MSIIYEALKKTQLNRETKRSVTRTRNRTIPMMEDWEWLDVGLAALIGILFIACVSLYVMHFNHRHKNHPTVTSSNSTAVAPAMVEQPAAESTADGITDEKDLVLNGVLLSDEEKLALINNKTFHVGDMVEGMRIVSIDFNSVKLANGKQLMTLRTAS